MKQKLIITTLLLAGLFISDEVKAKEPKENKSQKGQIESYNILGKYKGRTPNGSNGVRIRCNRNMAFICYTIIDDDGDIRMELGNGEILRSSILPPVQTGTENSPSGETCDTYTYPFTSPILIFNPSTGNWDPMPSTNIWVID